MRDLLGKAVFKMHRRLIRRLLEGSSRARVLVLSPDASSVLLVRNLVGRQSWSLPGGGLREGETAQTAARRELQEELGVDVPKAEFELLKEFDYNEPETGSSWRAFILVCRISPRTPLKPNPAELLGQAWFPLAGLPSDLNPLAAKVISTYLPTVIP